MVGMSGRPDWLQTDWVLGQFGNTRGEAVTAYMDFVRAGVEATISPTKGSYWRVHYPVPIHLQPVYRDSYGYGEGKYPVSESLSRRLISLPIFPSMSDGEVDYICETIVEFFGGSG